MRTNRSDFRTWVDDAIRAEFERHGHWTSETWLDLFLGSVEQQPTALCVAGEQAVLTRAQVLAAARHLAGHMLGRGIDAGDVVTVAVRMGTAEEIAAAVEFLLTPSASLVSGADLLVDGRAIAALALAVPPDA
jgi:non-ribosomal peptide synthetase component E (peptide arylation enzyme)